MGRPRPAAPAGAARTRSGAPSTTSVVATSRPRTSARRPPTWTRSRAVTPWVTGVDESLGGSGDPSPVTAFGVRLRDARGAARSSTVSRRCAVAACVVVRASVTSARTSSRLLVADGRRGRRCRDVVRRSRRRARARVTASRRAAADDALGSECDVLAPCALGGVLDDVTIPRLQCRAIVGAANNQLGSDGAADRTLARARHPVRARLRRERRRDHQHRRGVRRATTATRALAHAARDRGHHDARARSRRASAASRRSAPPRTSPARRIAEEGARPPLGARRPRRLDERRPPHHAPPVSLTVASPDAIRARSDAFGPLAHVAGVAERVAAGLRPHGETVRLVADRDLRDVARWWC